MLHNPYCLCCTLASLCLLVSQASICMSVSVHYRCKRNDNARRNALGYLSAQSAQTHTYARIVVVVVCTLSTFVYPYVPISVLLSLLSLSLSLYPAIPYLLFVVTACIAPIIYPAIPITNAILCCHARRDTIGHCRIRATTVIHCKHAAIF